MHFNIKPSLKTKFSVTKGWVAQNDKSMFQSLVEFYAAFGEDHTQYFKHTIWQVVVQNLVKFMYHLFWQVYQFVKFVDFLWQVSIRKFHQTSAPGKRQNFLGGAAGCGLHFLSRVILES